DPDSAWTYSYDALDRLISSDNNGTPNLLRAVLTNAYDPAGNRTSLAISMAGSNIFTNTYTYDALNRLKIVNQSGTGVSSKSAKYDYDAASDVLKLTRYKDTTQTTEVNHTDYTYGGMNRLGSMIHRQPNNTALVTYTYTYDNDGRILTFGNADGSVSYT